MGLAVPELTRSRLYPTKQAIAKAIAAGLLLTLFISAPAEARRRQAASDLPADSAVALPNPDLLLIEAYQALASNQLALALQKAEQLTNAYPNFQLAQLLRGDLLLMHARPVNNFGAGAPAGASADKLRELREEAAVRLKSLKERPAPDLYPRVILQMRSDQKQVLLVDAKKSRMYLYENQAGQPHFVNDYYVSKGRFGIDKFKEGDQKTPLGVYYITSHLSGSKLPDFYGPGALPLNYPNEWDKINGRSGSGIWLHGMPSATFSRPPLASDGCVVLTNPDFLKIASMVEIGRTPVIISEQIELVNAARWNSERQMANKLLDDWRADLESMNANRIMANYSRNFHSAQGEDLNTWFARQRPTWEGWTNPSVRLKDITLFRYPGKEEMLVSTFTQETSAGKSKISSRKRLYWLKESNKWRVVFESAV